MLNMIPNPENNPRKAGQRATRQQLFGDYSRYAVYAVHTRFEAVEWFVADAETTDEATGLPAIIRQEPTMVQAVEGLA